MQSVENSDNKPKRERRKRNDDEGRTFSCRCGKSYLSYPALYTHIKTKHSDEPLSKIHRNPDVQEQSMQNCVEKQQKGAQQKEKQKQKQKEKEKEKQKQKQKQKQQEDNYPLYGSNLPEVNNIEALRQFLFKYFPNIQFNVQQSYKNQINTQDKKDLKEMKDYWDGDRKKQDQNFKDVYQTSIKNVLGKFMLELENQVQNSSFKKFLTLFVLTMKRAVNKLKGQDYFREHNASQLPSFFDLILRQHLLIDNNDYLSNPTIAAKTLYYLGRWLYVNKFTNLSLKYNF